MQRCRTIISEKKHGVSANPESVFPAGIALAETSRTEDSGAESAPGRSGISHIATN
jgi:hypothetical protein